MYIKENGLFGLIGVLIKRHPTLCEFVSSPHHTSTNRVWNGQQEQGIDHEE